MHNFLVRHVYMPMKFWGYSRLAATVAVFTVSALLHEILVGGMCGVLTCWAFLGIMSQIPAIAVMDVFKKYLEKSQMGNVIFWVSLCILGMPTGVMIYSREVMMAAKV